MCTNGQFVSSWTTSKLDSSFKIHEIFNERILIAFRVIRHSVWQEDLNRELTKREIQSSKSTEIYKLNDMFPENGNGNGKGTFFYNGRPIKLNASIQWRTDTKQKTWINQFKRAFYFEFQSIVLYCRFGFNGVNEYWMILFLLLFFFVFCYGAFRFTWPSSFERIHDSQNTYPIKFRLSAVAVVIFFSVVWKCWRMDSWETQPYLLFTSL